MPSGQPKRLRPDPPGLGRETVVAEGQPGDEADQLSGSGFAECPGHDAAIEAHGQIAVSGRAAQGDLHQHIPAADAIGVRRQGGDRDSRRSIVVVGARSAQPRGKRCSNQRNETQTHWS